MPLFSSFKREVKEALKPEKVRRMMAALLGPCPACGQATAGHSYVGIASVEAGSNADRELQELMDSAKWAEALQYQAANLPKDVRSWFAVRCSVRCSSGRIWVVPVLQTFEMWSDDIRGEPRLLDAAEVASLERLVGDPWEAL
jgi:hypothetical protein